MKEIYFVMKRRFVFLLATIVALTAMGTTSIWAQESLGVTVAGVEVTSANAANLMKEIVKEIGNGTGKISYDASTFTLTLEGVKMAIDDSTNPIQTSSELNDFIIELKGDNVITSKGGRLELSSLNNIIKGSGSLSYDASAAVAIFLDNSNLTIEGGCTVDVKGAWGITGDMGLSEILVVKASTLKAKGDRGSITDLKDIKLEDCVITAPANAKIVEGFVVLGEEACTEQVVIEKVGVDYDITVKGVKVNASNAADILGDGTVAYTAETKTLFLRNATLEGGDKPALEAKSDLYIALEGANTLSATSSDAILLEADVEIRGEGSLNVKSKEQAGLKATKGLTVRGTSIVAEGVYGFLGDKNKLSFVNAKVELQGSTASLSGFGEVAFEGCHIHTPKGAKVDKGAIYLNGAICKEKVLIDKTIDYLFVGGKMLTSENYEDLFGNGSVRYDVENRLLTLNNFSFKTTAGESGINAASKLADITIVVNGTNTIETPYFGLAFSTNALIKGQGTLKVKTGSAAIALSGATLTIEEGVDVDLESDDNAITGLLSYPGSLVFKKAKVKILGAKGAINKCSSVTFEDCAILSPEGAKMEGDRLVLNGAAITTPVIIGIKDVSVNEVEATSAKVWGASGKVHLMVDTPTWVRIFSLDGVCLHAAEVAGYATFALPSSSYIVEIGNTTRKVLVR